jgi:PIN domain nuclease of toxin-antitoxin system
MSRAVVDTHALIWALTGQQKRLGTAARRIIERADRGEAALLSVV